MQADCLKEIAAAEYDLIVVGGGITGACCAWDASLRGLRVCLAERGDFASGTSANSLKTIHGGFRYLATANFARTRESIFERSSWLRIAPHLVRPLDCLIATKGHTTRGRSAFRAALALYNFMGRGRNQGLLKANQIPASRLIKRDEACELYPGFEDQNITGGVVWYDAQAVHSERLVVEVALAAQAAGAGVANYAEVTELLRSGDAVHGVAVRDALGDEEYEIKAPLVINAAGPWAGVLSGSDDPPPVQALGMNLVINRRLTKTAVGVESRGAGASDPLFGEQRYLFLAPWRESTLLGTSYTVHKPGADLDASIAKGISGLLAEFQQVCPELGLSRSDVSFFHWGLLPLDQALKPGGLAEKYRIVDHAKSGGLEGLISLSGVKYTTGRALAQQAVDLAMSKLAKEPVACLTAFTPLIGGALQTLAEDAPDGLDQATWQRLQGVYGAKAQAVAAVCEVWPRGAEPLTEHTKTMGAEVLYTVHHEMARTLGDLVLRRTGMGDQACPPRLVLETAAAIMGIELGWDQARYTREVEETLAVYAPLEPRIG